MATLVPVEGNPFDTPTSTLIPVEGNPFDERPLTIRAHATPEVANPSTGNGYHPAADDPFSDENASRAIMQGAVGGALGVPGLLADTAGNAVYGARKGLSKLGVVNPPDPEQFYGKDAGSGFFSYFPAMTAISKLGKMAPDAMGLPEPSTKMGRIVNAGLSGLTGGVVGAGVGGAIGAGAQVPRLAQASEFLAANPAGQALAGGTQGGVAQYATEAGYSPETSMGAGVLLSMLGPAGMAAWAKGANTRVLDVTRPSGRDQVAASVLQDTAVNPAQAAANAVNNREYVPGVRSPGPVATQDRGLMAVSPSLQKLAPSGIPTAMEASNNQARADLLAQHGVGVPDANGLMRHDNLQLQAEQNATRAQDMFNYDREPVDISHIDDHLTGLMQPKNPQAVQRAAGFFRSRLRTASDPIVEPMLDPDTGAPVLDANGRAQTQVTGYTAAPQDLYNITRKDLGTRMNATDPTDQTASSLRNARRALRPARDMLDEAIGSGTEPTGAGNRFDAYMANQRDLRARADQAEFANKLFERATLGQRAPDGTPVNPNDLTMGGIPQFSGPKLLNAMRDSQQGRTIIPGNRTTFEDLPQPTADAFRRVALDLNKQGGPTAQKSMTPGSNTIDKANFDERVAERTAANLPTTNTLRSKAPLIAGVAAPLVTGLLSHKYGGIAGLIGGPAAGMTIFGGARAFGAGAGRVGEGALAGVNRTLGGAYVNPGEMGRLLQLQRIPRMTARQAVSPVVEQFARSGIMGGYYGGAGAN